ncbi:SDR family NAD(P)-dependent oxidoreductase [Parabacteroides acidifaciens]|uniref:SDR family NAD(P)-dependent oxidoreductase n=1 Tax=Parabacteroides acidifaciens TaxID=2290935 RepID=A0A3D8HCF3_9BACT|nr:SDR family NAD(P)-dependent oxidoreductase [Parabacteroides acidifaciens]MBC8602588.1 SDR family NAD(P)-dependent oxidoreductase [Parabacteroides acidifaciens]RDU48659.1 SDR family NAD(P)-dependent oxidoreductase [Parabacteroides acidifaciens]
MTSTKRIIIIGATSGIGNEVARLYIKQGWRIGVAGRRLERLEELRAETPGQIEAIQLDVTCPDAPERLAELIRKVGGMDVFLLSSGVGSQNRALDPEIELATVQTNTVGFTRMVTAAYGYFKEHGGGQLAVISSIAGTKGLGAAPSYSATKRYQNTYIEALDQLAQMEKLPIVFTDIRPGFVKTDLLKNDKYPMLMSPEYVARKIVKAIGRKKRRAVIDWKYAILVFFWKLIPGFIWRRLPIHN